MERTLAKDSPLIVIGDSYINWLSHSFPADIEKESGQRWRMQAIGVLHRPEGKPWLLRALVASSASTDRW